MSNPWFRMYSEFATDPKVQMLHEAMQRRLLMIMCMRCSNSLVTLQEQEIAFQLRITDSELAETKAVFIAKGFIDSAWNVRNWEKRQFASDTSKARVAKHRALQKEKQSTDGSGNVTLQKQNDNGLEQNRTDTDIEGKPSLSPVKPATPPNCPHVEIIDLYAKHLPNLPQPKVELWDGTGATNLRERWRWLLTAKKKSGERYATDTTEGLAWFDRFFAYVAESDFLTGRDSKWSCDLLWLVKAANFTKVVQGNYENQKAAA